MRKVKLVDGDILLDFFMDFFLITSGIMLKRTCLERTGMFDENLEVGEDFDFFLRLAQNYKARVVKEKLFRRRVWVSSLSRGHFELSKKIDINTLKHFLKHNPDFYQKYRPIAKHRISELYFKLGYFFVQHPERSAAISNFFKSLKIYLNIKSIKGLIRPILPFEFTKKIDNSS